MNHASTTEYAATNIIAQYGAPFRKNMETTPAQEQPANAETSHSCDLTANNSRASGL